MIMGFNRQLPLFIVFAGAIFLVQRKLSLNLQTVLINHESSSAYLHQDDDEKHTQQQPQPPLDSAVPRKQEEHRNTTSFTVPPTSAYPTNGIESVPSRKEQIRTAAHQSDTTTLQNDNRKNATKKSPNVLYTVFAGRKNRMLLQEPYWAEMHRLGQIDKVHLWNYTLHNRFTMENLQYLRHVERKYPFVTIMEPSLVEMPETLWFDSNHSLRDNVIANYGNGRATFRWPGVRWYTEYYRYYSVNPYDGVIIKADDDIVYVNSSMVRPFAEYLWNHENVFLLSASVVNQGLCAHYQQVHGAIPKQLMDLPMPGNGMGDLHDNATNALKLHLYFLKHASKFFIPQPEYYPFDYTINVNFIAIRGRDFHNTFQLIQEMLHEEGRYYDEGAITWDAIRKRKYQEGIYMPLVVAHATFGAQNKVTRKVLDAYVQYGKTERADLYEDILNDWSPQEEA
jgi:hypothetical protein